MQTSPEEFTVPERKYCWYTEELLLRIYFIHVLITFKGWHIKIESLNSRQNEREKNPKYNAYSADLS